MDKIQGLLKRLQEEAYELDQEEEEVSKNLAKEDALTLIAEFVKDVKKKFSKPADKKEILDAAKKTLEFFINEIDVEEDSEPEFPVVSVSADVSDDDTEFNDFNDESDDEEF